MRGELPNPDCGHQDMLPPEESTWRDTRGTDRSDHVYLTARVWVKASGPGPSVPGLSEMYGRWHS